MSTPTQTAIQVKTKTVSATKFAIAVVCLGLAALAAAVVSTRAVDRTTADTTRSTTTIVTPTVRPNPQPTTDSESLEAVDEIEETQEDQEESEDVSVESENDLMFDEVENGVDGNLGEIEMVKESAKPLFFVKKIELPLSVNSNKYGNWAIFSLERKGKTFKVIGVRQQKYNVAQKEFFENLFSHTPVSERGFAREQIVRRNKRAVSSEPFIDSAPFITESFDDNGNVSLIDYEVTSANSLEVKVPIENYSDQFELLVRDTKTNQNYKLMSEKESRDWMKKLKNNSISAGGSLKLASQGKPSLCDYLKPAVSNHNKNDKNRTNIIFIGFCYPQKNVFVDSLPFFIDFDGSGLKVSKTDKATGKKNDYSIFGLFSVVPFSTNKDKFNLWYIDKIYDPEDIGYKFASCDNSPTKLKYASLGYLSDQCGLPNVKVDILEYKSFTSHADAPGLNAVVSTKPSDKYEYENAVTGEEFEFSPGSTRTFVHEWGHQFGGLADEYTKEFPEDKPSYPNCSDTEEEGKGWWINLFPDMKLEKGCSYADNNWRFFYNGLMRCSGCAKSFGDINELYLCKKIFDVSGEADGDCDKFFPEICDDKKDNNLNKKIDCDDSDCKNYYECGGLEKFCADGLDNNGDEKIDCKDKDCQQTGCKEFIKEAQWQEWKDGGASTGSDYTQLAVYCHDGLDNDLNGKVDCVDAFCQNAAGGCEVNCADGKDNDEDGIKDCEDPDCDAGVGPNGQMCKYKIPSYEIAICGGTQALGCFTDKNLPSGWEKAEKKDYFCEVYSGIGDAVSQTIKAESPWKAAQNCCTYLSNFLTGGGYYNVGVHDKTITSPGVATAVDFYNCTALESLGCGNGIDDDGDSKIDCADANCDGVYVLPKSMCEPGKEKQCNDGFDNDGDGVVDCKDGNCNCFQLKETKCSDDKDNDGNGKTDCADPNCQKYGCVQWASEAAKGVWKGVGDAELVIDFAKFCHDGVDNDGNGLKDCNEPVCRNQPQGCEFWCRSGSDEDGDGKIDCADPDCNCPSGWDGFSCQSSDGEADVINLNKKGTVKGANVYSPGFGSGGPYEVQTDKCKDDKTAIEWTCNSQKYGIEWETRDCAEWGGEGVKCVDGACVKK